MRSKYIVLSVALSVSVMSVAWSADEPAPPAAATAQPAATPAATRAAQPAAQAAPAAQSAASSTANEAATKAPAKATATATAASDTKSTPDAQEKRILAAGYKKKTQNGQTFYCRKETPIGSRFESERCETAEEMAMRAQQGKDFIKSTTAVAGSRN